MTPRAVEADEFGDNIEEFTTKPIERVREPQKATPRQITGVRNGEEFLEYLRTATPREQTPEEEAETRRLLEELGSTGPWVITLPTKSEG